MNTLPPPPADMPDHALHSAYRKTAWRVIPLLMVCYLVAYLDRVNVGFAKLQMLDDLKFSEAVYGLGAGVFFVGYLMFEIPSHIAQVIDFDFSAYKHLSTWYQRIGARPAVQRGIALPAPATGA